MVAQALTAQGYDVWIDDQLLSHRPFADSIEEALSSADAAIVLWSDAAVRSDWVRSEASRARAAGKLIQLRLDGCALPMPFDQIHCIDLSPWTGDTDMGCWRATLSSIDAAITARNHASKTPAAKSSAMLARTGLERRRITALACAVSDWRTLSTGDPEDILHIVDDFQAAVSAAVAQHGGSVVERTDGSALAYFGHDIAGEEDGADAIRTATAVRDRMTDPPVSIGIATGIVVVRADADGAASVIGDVPDVARSLAAAATRGGILASSATQRVSAGLFAFGPPESVPREGAGDPILAAEVVDSVAVASRSQARIGSAQTHLIGREAELRRLHLCWDAATEGMGQVALLTGDAGIGKSTLVEAFRDTLTADHAQVTLHCGPSLSASALHPVSDAIIQAALIERGDTPDKRREKLDAFAARGGIDDGNIVSRLAELVGAAGAASPDTTPERRRALILDAIIQLLAAMTSRRPGLIVVEDLHWADPTTLELITQVIAQSPDRSWMILGTARPEFVCDWHEHADVEAIALLPLEQAEVRALCRQRDPEGRLSSATIDAILARGDGNPLFVEEIASFALAEHAGNGTSIAIPDTIHELLVARLDRLGPAREVARTAAVLGRRFGYDLIAAVTADTLAGADLRGALRDLAKQGVLTVTGTPPRSTYSFRHALFADAAYETVAKRERETLHAKIADVLRAQFADLTVANPALLAQHLTQSGQIAAAVPLWALAGAAAAAKAAHGEAVTSFHTALDLLRRGERDAASTATELQMLLGLAVSLSATCGYSAPEVGIALGEARAICDAIGNDDNLFVVLRGLCAFTIVRGELDTAEDLARRCLDVADRTGLPVHRIEGLCSLGYIRWTKGDLVEGPALLREMAALYVAHDGATLPRLTPMDPLANALGPMRLAALALGDAAGVADYGTQMDRMIEVASDGYSRAFSAYFRGSLIAPGVDPVASLHATDRGIAIAEDAGYALVLALLAISRGSLMAEMGDAAGGLALARPALAAFRRVGQRHAMPFNLGEVAWLHGLQGDLDAALALIDEAIAVSEETGERYWMAPLLLRKSRLLAMSGDPVASGAVLAEARSTAEAQGAKGFLSTIEVTAPATITVLASA